MSQENNPLTFDCQGIIFSFNIYRRLRNSRSSFASLNQNKEEFVQSTNSGMKSG